jgi:hypothetical protein
MAKITWDMVDKEMDVYKQLAMISQLLNEAQQATFMRDVVKKYGCSDTKTDSRSLPKQPSKKTANL